MKRHLAAVLVAPLLVGTARADDTLSSAIGGRVVETSHKLTVVMGRGHARLLAERTIESRAPRADLASLSFVWPSGSVTTGLALRDHDRWSQATLLDREPALAVFTRATGIGDGAAEPTAMLDNAGNLGVFPVRPGEPKTVRVEGLVATSFSGGRHALELPKLGSPGVPTVVTLLAESAGDALFRDDAAVLQGSTFVLTRETRVAVTPRGVQGVAVRVASPSTGPRALFHVGVDVGTLSEAPRRASVVVILDASRSRTADDIERQRALALRYLSRLADADVQVLAFDRRVDTRFDDFTPSRDAVRKLAAMPFVRRNGSDLPVALARAAALFDQRGGTDKRRVLVLGDLLGPDDADPGPALRALAERGAVTHLVHVGAPTSALAAQREHPFSPAVRATGGLVWAIGGAEVTHAASIEELVRPVRVDDVAWEVPLVAAPRFASPSTFAEGEGFAFTGMTDAPVTSVVLRGALWATKVAFRGAPTDAENVRWSALAFGGDVDVALSRDEKRRLAHRGHVATDETAFVVLSHGARGSPDGVPDAFAAGGLGLSGGSSSSDFVGGAEGFRHGLGFDGATRLAEMLRGAFVACGGTAPVEMVIETTLDEVASARVPVVPAGAASTLSACLVESAFSLDLPSTFAAPHVDWRVTLRPPLLDSCGVMFTLFVDDSRRGRLQTRRARGASGRARAHDSLLRAARVDPAAGVSRARHVVRRGAPAAPSDDQEAAR